MKIVGCDLHARQQTIAMVESETGEFSEKTLAHEGNMVREFYAALELLLFSMGYKSVDLIRSAWKRFVLIVQPLQFHDSLDKNSGTFVALILPRRMFRREPQPLWSS